MRSQTSLVASQVRIQQWAEMIRECQSRPEGMKVNTWCAEHNISKANYYYRLRCVREACLEIKQKDSGFVELPVPEPKPQTFITVDSKPVAVLRGANGLSVEICSGASKELIQSLVGAMVYAK